MKKKETQGGILYQVPSNFYQLKIIEQPYIKKTESFYWKTDKIRDALNTNYIKSFDKKEDAIECMRCIIERNISLAESSLKYANAMMEKFLNTYSSNDKL